jgi:DNA-nicking Smr family endonuclease
MNNNNFDYDEWLKIIKLFKPNTNLNKINDIKKMDIEQFVKSINPSVNLNTIPTQNSHNHKEICKAPINEIKKIKNNKITIERYLDLHGFTSNIAEKRFYDFVNASYIKKLRLLLVITGKGQNNEGVLRQNILKWINNKEVSSYILYYDEALNKDGGSGAYYIFLKKNFT